MERTSAIPIKHFDTNDGYRKSAPPILRNYKIVMADVAVDTQLVGAGKFDLRPLKSGSNFGEGVNMKAIATIGGITIEQGSENPYADLGSPNAEEMLVKANLAREIAEIIKSRHLTQQRAAELLGMTQPKLSALLCGKFRGISQAKMMGCLNRLARDVEIVVKKAGRRSVGHTLVVMG